MWRGKMDWGTEFERLGVRRVKKDGDFIFYSGRHSNVKYDFDYLYKHTDLYSRACHDLLKKACLNIDPKKTCFVGPAYGGISLAFELARQCGARAAYARKITFGFDIDECFKPEPGDVIILCDDVITAGTSLAKVRSAIERHGIKVIFHEKVLVFVNRSGCNSFCLWPHARPPGFLHQRSIVALVETNEPGLEPVKSA